MEASREPKCFRPRQGQIQPHHFRPGRNQWLASGSPVARTILRRHSRVASGVEFAKIEKANGKRKLMNAVAESSSIVENFKSQTSFGCLGFGICLAFGI